MTRLQPSPFWQAGLTAIARPQPSHSLRARHEPRLSECPAHCLVALCPPEERSLVSQFPSPPTAAIPLPSPVFSHPFTNGLDLPLCKSTYRQPHLPLGKAELWAVGGWNGNSCVGGRRPGMQVWAWGKKELFPPLTVAPGQGRMLSEDASKATQPGVKPGPS